MDISDKNIYENIINFADNRTILNMLSVNKKFNDPIFFEKVIDRKYPLLKQFKEKNESWRQFFVKMAYYIAKLEEEYDIPCSANLVSHSISSGFCKSPVAPTI